MKSEWSLYLIRTHSGSLYCGITTDIERRFGEHCAGSVKSARYLRGKGPLELVFHQLIGSRSAASKAEIRVKRLAKQTKEALVAGRVDLGDAIGVEFGLKTEL